MAHPDLDLDESLDFQRAEWRIQRVGRWLLAAFVIAAALGVFGNGWLSRAEAGDRAATWLEYERFTRAGAPTRLVVHLRPSSDEIKISMNRSYFDAIQVERVIPLPVRTDVGADQVTWTFPVSRVAGPIGIVFDLEPTTAGRLEAHIGTGTGTPLRVTQWAYF